MNDDIWARVAEATHARDAPLEAFCEVVMKCGYTPDECRVNVYPEINGAVRKVLHVRGVAVFEVTSTMRSEPENNRVVFTVDPRIIEWPLGHPVKDDRIQVTVEGKNLDAGLDASPSASSEKSSK